MTEDDILNSIDDMALAFSKLYISKINETNPDEAIPAFIQTEIALIYKLGVLDGIASSYQAFLPDLLSQPVKKINPELN
jgi:hypothetical protein